MIGARQYTLLDGGPRWLGYYASPGPPDGWIVQAADPFDVVTSTGPQQNAASFPGITGVGGWMVSRVEPVPEPQTWTLVASAVLLAASRYRRRRRLDGAS